MSQKNWDKILKELENDDHSTKSSPEDFFQQIYTNATEEQRRAMIKSFQTSGGTVLSTNWDEVKVKDYEGKDRPELPRGHEWKPYK